MEHVLCYVNSILVNFISVQPKLPDFSFQKEYRTEPHLCDYLVIISFNFGQNLSFCTENLDFRQITNESSNSGNFIFHGRRNKRFFQIFTIKRKVISVFWDLLEIQKAKWMFHVHFSSKFQEKALIPFLTRHVTLASPFTYKFQSNQPQPAMSSRNLSWNPTPLPKLKVL